MESNKANKFFNYMTLHPEVIPVLIIIIVTLSIPLCIITFSKKKISSQTGRSLDSLHPRESSFFIEIDVRPNSGCIPWEGHPFLMEFRGQDLIVEQSEEVQRAIEEMKKAKEQSELDVPEEITVTTETEPGKIPGTCPEKPKTEIEDENKDKEDDEEQNEEKKEEIVVEEEIQVPKRKPKKIQALKLLAWNFILEESMKKEEHLSSYYYFT